MRSLLVIRQLILCVLVGYGSHALAKENTLLIIGDSISAGYGIDTNRGWVKQLEHRIRQEHPDYRVINDSISGDTTANGLARLKPALTRFKPDLVIIELGGNDGLRGISAQAMKSNLTKMVQLIKKEGAGVILLAVPLPPNYGPSYISQFMDVYHLVADEQSIPLVPDFLANIGGNPDLMQPDGIHPNQKAQAILLDNAWPVIKKQL